MDITYCYSGYPRKLEQTLKQKVPAIGKPYKTCDKKQYCLQKMCISTDYTGDLYKDIPESGKIYGSGTTEKHRTKGLFTKRVFKTQCRSDCPVNHFQYLGTQKHK